MTEPGASPQEARERVDQEVVRRVIKSHLSDVKNCYEPELAKNPRLGGVMNVDFTIGAAGRVLMSSLDSSSMHNEAVETCTVMAVRRWLFPRLVGNDVLMVSYPFKLTPLTMLSASPGGAGLVETERLGPAAYLHRSTDAHGIPSNGLVAIVRGGLLLIDTAWTEEQTEAILRWGDEVLALPWVGAVITHEHADRDGGLGALFRRKIPTAALDLTVAKLARRGVRGVTTLFTARAATFADPRGFEAYYPGPGHAADNIVIALPSAGILFGGCLIKSADAKDLGFTGDADLASWPAAVRRVADKYRQSTIVIPGHGPVDANQAACPHTLDLLKASPK
jgi:metallo-beta-lactamase class B